MEGKLLGNRYEVMEKLGGGGMAVVYKGKDILLNRAVTIKVLRDQYAHDPEFVKRFRREAQAVASLSHPNIVSIYDVGQDTNLHYLVMEYIEGRTLKDLIQEHGQIQPLRAVVICQQICDALQHAHDNGVIHRDIKPHNILMTRNGRVKVTDFGIALAASSATVTYNGAMVGSVHYVSPQQARGEPTTHQSDVYSAGIVLYEMLTGQVPFVGDSPISVALKHVQENPQPPRQVNPSIPIVLERVVLKALAKELRRRYETAREMWIDLEKVRLALAGEEETPTEELAVVEGDDLPEINGGRKRRRMRPVGWLLVTALLIGLVYAGYFGFREWLVVEETRVPDVVELSVPQARERLAEAGLKMEVDQRRYHPNIPQGYVVSQSYPPETVIKKGRTVKVDVSLGPELKEVPDVIGQTLRFAKTNLQNEGFMVDPEVEEVSHPDVPAGRVVDTDPAPRTRAPKGSAVKLTVSSGPPAQLIPMPNLIGKTLDEARVELDQAQLQMGTVEYDDFPDFFAGQVARQDPEPGVDIMQGSPVKLVVSKSGGPPAQPAEVNLKVSDDGREHQIRIVVVDAKGSHQEYDQRHAPGERVRAVVPYYGRGKIQIYQDDALFYEQNVP